MKKVESKIVSKELQQVLLSSSTSDELDTVTTGASFFDQGMLPLFHELGYMFVKGGSKEAEFFESIDKTGDAVGLFFPDGKIYHFNGAFGDLFGFSGKELKGSSFFSLVQRSYRTLIVEKVNLAVKNISREIGTPQEMAFVFRGLNGFGEVRSFEGIFSGFWDGGEALVAGVIRDITRNPHLFKELRRLEKNYSILTETVNEAIVRIDEEFNIVFANSAVKKTFGYEIEEVQGKNFSILFPPEIFNRHRDEIAKYFFIDDEHREDAGLTRSVELLGKHKSRGVSPMEISFGNSSDFRGRTLTCIIHDITQYKNNERRLRKLAFHDKLTNLGNRDLFHNDITNVLEQLKSYPDLGGALLFLDLDGFKQVNDTLGHKAGDALLLETARRLHDCLRESDSIYRFGGDEFVVLLSQVKKKADVSRVAGKILSAVRTPYYLSSDEENQPNSMINIGVSIGIALFPQHGKGVEPLIQNADLAMYASKDSGKNRYTFYEESMVSRATENMKIEQGIKNALHNNEFDLKYQPLVDINGNIRGVEALLRWTSIDMGRISPGVFIPVAEDKGSIIPIGKWVMMTACREIGELMKHANRDFYLTVNLSPVQLETQDIIKVLRNAILHTGFDPSHLRLEITESSLMNEPEEVTRKMHRIIEDNPGIQFIIDDFGTGYSSLSYLAQFPVESLKIDLSFVTGLQRPENRKIINTILTLANTLGLKVVAEGVETREQWEYFRQYPDMTLQGYHFGKAIPVEELRILLEGNEPLNTMQ